MEKPCVATNSYGMPEVVIDGKTGYCFPSGDVDALANAIHKISGASATEQKARPVLRTAALWTALLRCGLLHLGLHPCTAALQTVTLLHTSPHITTHHHTIPHHTTPRLPNPSQNVSTLPTLHPHPPQPPPLRHCLHCRCRSCELH